MAADFSKPLATQSSDDILQQLKDNIQSLAKMELGSVATAPVGTIAYITDRFKRKKSDGTWEELPLTLNLNAISSTSIEAESIIVQDTLGGVSGGAATGNTVEISGGDITASGNVSAGNITTLQNDVTALKQNSAASLVLGTDAGASNDLNIVKSAGNVSINVPDAAETVRGVLTTSNQTLGGVKTLASKKIQLGNSSTASNNWHLVGDAYFSISSGNHSSGTERIRIDASGNVGIGTTTPSSKLHVAGTALLSPGSSGGLTISTGTIDAGYTVSNVLGRAAIETLTNHPIIIRTNDVDRVTIHQSGNVGVGTTGPTAVLHVHGGDIKLSNTNNTSLVLSKKSDRTKILINDSENSLVISDTGHVGIDTEFPEEYGKLTITRSEGEAVGSQTSATNLITLINTTQADNIQLRISGCYKSNSPGSTKLTQTSIGFYQNSQTDNKSSIAFSTHNGSTLAERVRISAEGRVGIGTAAPEAKLHIYDSSATPYVFIQGKSSTSSPAGTGKAGILLDVNGSGGFSITNDSSSGSRVLKIDSTTSGNFTGTTALAIDSSGNVGVGGVSRAGILLDVAKNANSDMWLAVHNPNAGNAANSGLLFGNNTNQFGAQLRFVGSESAIYGGANSFNIIQTLDAPVCFYTNNTERFRIDGSGRIGIRTTPLGWNTSATSATLDVAGNFGMMTHSSQTYFVQNAYLNSSNQWIRKTALPCSLYVLGNNGDHLWYSAGTGAAGSNFSFSEKLSLSPSGILSVVGTGKVSSWQSEIRGEGISYSGAATKFGRGGNLMALTWSPPYIYGSIDNNSEAVLGTVSDYRLKENFTPIESTLDLILQLSPGTYNPKDFDGTVNLEKQYCGLIAHEVQAIIPSVVLGQKDNINNEGQTIYQSVDYAGIVPYLIVAIKELKQYNDELNSKLQQLENQLKTITNA